LEEQVNADRSFGLSDLALSGFLRVVTNPRAFSFPTPPTVAMRQADALRARPARGMTRAQPWPAARTR
jgi:hypothetical protein